MNTDNVIEVGIDQSEKLYIKPGKERFPLIYRTASEVHWDEKKACLYSPKPREWTYLDWYKHILKVVEQECNCKLVMTDNTNWVNVPDSLKIQMMVY
jgi:hypothetical protein